MFKRSEQARKRMSLAHLGKKLPPFTEEHKRKLRESNLGKKRSEETKKKISIAKIGHTPWNKGLKGVMPNPWNKGKKTGIIPKSVFKKGNKGYWLGKKRLDMIGENHPMWKGGKCKRKDERNDGLYANWRLQVYRRDNYKCRINKNCQGRIIAHHILPWRDYPELRYEINNGITLCQAHHPRRFAEEKRLVPFFMGLVSVSKERI